MSSRHKFEIVFFFFQAEDGIRELTVTGVQTCALPILQWNLNSTRSRAEIALRYQAQTMFRSLPVEFSAASNEFLDAGTGIREVPETIPRHFRITEHEPGEQRQRNAVANSFGDSSSPSHRMPDKTACQNNSINNKSAAGHQGPDQL